jgi:hypothetical protein
VQGHATYVGGKDRNKHFGKRNGGVGRSVDTKTPVFGMVERGGRVIAKVTKDAKTSTIFPIIAERVLPASTVYTDCYTTYMTPLGRCRKDTSISAINHTAKIYVMGDIHTNTIEGFWSLLKEGNRWRVSSGQREVFADLLR